MAQQWVHRHLNEDVEAIGGHYVLVKEERLHLGGHDVLVIIGNAAFDSTCCGVGGCAYALVPGTVVRYHAGQSPDGLPVSEVKPVRDDRLQKEVRRAITAREVVQQVIFMK
jgi:hypothetical protein